MRILIWGGDSWANQGDAAVLEGTLCSLRAASPAASIVVASDAPELTASRHNVVAVRRVSLGFLWALWRSDLVLWGGGQLLQNDSSKSFLLVQLCFLALAMLLRKPVVCYAQGAGPIDGRLSRFLTRLIVGRLPLVMVRDATSADRLASLGIGSDRVRVVADPSFCLPSADRADVDALLERLHITRPFAVIAVRRWGHYRGGWLPVRLSRRAHSADHERAFQAFCATIAAAGDYLTNELGLQVVFLPMCPGGDQDDDLVAQAVRGQMLSWEQSVVLDDVLPSMLLKGVLGRAEIVLAMRTHAGMLAAASATPVASISYQGKGEAFMSEVGLTDYVLSVDAQDEGNRGAVVSSSLRGEGQDEGDVGTNADLVREQRSISRDSVIALVDRVWRKRMSIRAHLACETPNLRARAREATQLALREASRVTRGGDPRLGSAYRALIAPKIGLTLDGRVLEVGAADGRLLQSLGARGVALDLAPEPLLGTRTPFVQGDATRMPFADHTFDTIVAFDVLEHVEDDCALVRELARVVRPGGTLWISVPSRDTAIFPPMLTGWAHREWGHVRPGYSRSQLAELFTGRGEIDFVSWNEPVYRAGYLPLKALSLVWPAAAVGLLPVIAWLDERLRDGDSGHFFVRVQVTKPGADSTRETVSSPPLRMT